MGSVRALAALLFLGISAALSGCTTMAEGPAFEASTPPPAGQAVIYVFRPDQDYKRAIAPDVTLDGSKVGTIANAGYLAIEVAPGQHRVEVTYDFWTWGYHCTPAVVQTKPGEVHYVQMRLYSKIDILLDYLTYCDLEELDSDVALPLITQTRLSQP